VLPDTLDGTNMVIRDICGDAAFPPPRMPYAIKNVA
jgi:hypothetical protein